MVQAVPPEDVALLIRVSCPPAPFTQERSNGFYVPSPGVIYPALTYLDEIGHAAAEPVGNRKQTRDCTPDEARRIARILDRATSETLGTKAD